MAGSFKIQYSTMKTKIQTEVLLKLIFALFVRKKLFVWRALKAQNLHVGAIEIIEIGTKMKTAHSAM